MSLSWGSKPTPEERAADKADRAASRAIINKTRIGLQEALKTVKKATAKEDYPVIQKLVQDMLNWLKANPSTNEDDINDYSTNMIQQNPLIQSMNIRKQWADGFMMFEAITQERIKTITKKNPELLASANEILAPMRTYRDTLLTWFKNGQLTLLPQDYEDKGVEISETIRGENGKEDKFKVQAFFDNTKLTKEKVTKYKEDNKIIISRLIKKIVSITLRILFYVLIGFGCFLGASYATNLNIYRSFSFRVFYAIYGALFFIFVVPYELIYKKWLLGESLPMYGYIPLMEGPVEKWSWIGQNIFFFFEKRPVANIVG